MTHLLYQRYKMTIYAFDICWCCCFFVDILALRGHDFKFKDQKSKLFKSLISCHLKGNKLYDLR